MTTPYICTTCKTVFEGHDPVRFGTMPPCYPACPKGLEEAYALFQEDEESVEFWQGQITFSQPHMQAMAVASRKHIVDLQVVEAPPVKPLSFADRLKQGLPSTPQVPSTPVAKPLWKVKTAAERAQELVVWVDKCCNGSAYGTSAQYPNDRLHPAKGEKYETAEVIALARDTWNQRAGALNHHALQPQFKDDWRNRTEADFLRDITPGQEGRHIVHVILGTKGEKGWVKA